jgi:hypothetical protein
MSTSTESKYASVPTELLEQAVSILNESKLMMNGGMFTLQDLPMPTKVKRSLVERSVKAGSIAGKLFAHTLKDNASIADEIKEVDDLAVRTLKDSLQYFDNKHNFTPK